MLLKGGRKNEKTYVIIGGLWFDKENGNTYNSAKIIETDGELNIFYTAFTAGYGDGYMQEARRYIRETLKQEDAQVINGGFFYINKKQAVKGLF